MVEFEKVERLVEKANVSYEDAKVALENANGDMLDAMIALERAGKTRGPQQSYYSTSGAAEQSPYRDVPTVIEANKQSESKSFFKDLGSAIKRGFRYTIDNSILVTRNGNEIIKLPLWISIIAMLAAWELLLIVIVISLFFDCRYSIIGKNNAKDVNGIMSQASDFAGKIKRDFSESFGSSEPAGTPEDSIYRSAQPQSDAATVVEPANDDTSDNVNE